MALPASIGAAGSLASSKKGGGGKKGGSSSPNLQGLYDKFSTILDAGMNLYKTASGTGSDSLRATDSRALEEYQKNVMTQAQAELGAYDAAAAAAGSPVNKMDTAKERSRTQIATGMATDVGNKRFAMDESYLQRLQALLPGTGSAVAGFGGAGALDQMESNRQSGIMDAIFKLASSIPGSKGRTPTNPFAGGYEGAGGDSEMGLYHEVDE